MLVASEGIITLFEGIVSDQLARLNSLQEGVVKLPGHTSAFR